MKDCSDITFDREHQRKNCMVERVDESGHTTSDVGYGPKKRYLESSRDFVSMNILISNSS